MRVLLLLAISTLLAVGQDLPTEVVLSDSGARVFEVACDELHCRPQSGTAHSVKSADQKTPAGIRAHALDLEEGSEDTLNLVLYVKDKPRTRQNRRTLSRKILVETEVNGQVLAEAAGAVRFEAPKHAPGHVILFFAQPGDSIRLLAKVQALPGVKRANPALGRRKSRRLEPNDPRYGWSDVNTSYQWHLKNTGQNGSVVGLDARVESVWDRYLGTGVTISIVDDGLEVAHPDIAPNANTSIDHDWNDSTPDDPTPPLEMTEDGSYFDHGTSVAGVSAARGNNGIGVSGVAPRASLVGLKILTADTSDDEDAAALGWRTDVIDVSNNSWGPGDTGDELAAIPPIVATTLQTGVSDGRDGRGTIYVWSAGNGRDEGDYANYDGFVNAPETIGVGSVSFEGKQSYYSESGANVMVSAPSDNWDGEPGITTTTLTSNRSYTDTFGGTSSAAPLVSGVIALMLEANPNLGWRDVQEILMRSARQLNPSDSEWVTNGAGLTMHHGFGAGMVDAAAAVNLALDWTNLGSATSVMTSTEDLGLGIPDDDNAGVSRVLTLPSSLIRAEHVILTVDITHPYRGDLVITLTSPSGTVSRFSEAREDSNADYESFPMLSVRHWGEEVSGDWTVTLSDLGEGDEGVLNDVKLEVRGSSFPADGFGAWMASKVPSADLQITSISGRVADPDGDELVNLVEYAFSEEPLTYSEKSVLQVTRQSPSTFEVQFDEDTSKSDIRYILDSSENLISWEELDTTSRAPNGNIRVREALLNTSSQDHRFLRLRVE